MNILKFYFIPAIFLCAASLSACTAFDKFDKYANGRYYEMYTVSNLSACNYKVKFTDCAEKMDFDIKISDDNNKIALSKYINHNDEVSYLGFTRDNYAAQTQPIRDFLAWAKRNATDNKRIVMKRPAGNIAGYLFENTEVDYSFDFVHTRADVPMLVINVSKSTRYYGFTVQEAEKMLETLDSWYGKRFIGKQFT
ncbi:hypothetical protein [Pantoea vagans]|uniref:hypothetical protein n=1 Tax=Pantoea vagans TaxID=470934 RepID=UPI0010938634|nr:hypothetical protein [Pantoea vagans]QCA03697.1 hypothetical protein EGO56_05845 [Pantoea vagans]